MRRQNQSALLPDHFSRTRGRQTGWNALVEKQPDQVSVGGGDLLAHDHPQLAAAGQLLRAAYLIMVGDCDAIDRLAARGGEDARGGVV